MTTIHTENPLSEVPLPAGAVRVYDWEDVQCGDPHRCFVGSSWVVFRDDSDGLWPPSRHKDIEVWIDGAQWPDRIEADRGYDLEVRPRQ